jgi:hypothetical protein
VLEANGGAVQSVCFDQDDASHTAVWVNFSNFCGPVPLTEINELPSQTFLVRKS